VNVEQLRDLIVNGPMKPPDFSEARQLFGQYRFRQKQTSDDVVLSDWIAEADLRLGQLEWITIRIDELQTEHDRLTRTRSDADTQERPDRGWRREEVTKEILLLVDAFYYFAWRFREILQSNPGLPGLKKFEAIGIRAVRNDLLEHPQNVASNSTYMYGKDLLFGPVIKPFSGSPANGPARGLYLDALEVIDELVPRLKRFL
jgi:hypothetical protein